MSTTLDFLDAVKARHSIASDYKLAKVIGASKQTISSYRNGKSAMEDSIVLRVADLLDEDPAVMLAAVHAERAKRPEEKAAWRSIMERLGGAAACALLGLALVSPSPSQASQPAPEKPALKIM